MAVLHTWSGLVLGWLLYAVFLTGTASYLRPEITGWMHPEIPPAHVDPAEAAVAAVSHLTAVAPRSPSWFINLAGEREPMSTAYWRDAGSPTPIHVVPLDPRTGAEPDRETSGGEFFYRFHFQLYAVPILWGRWIVCIAAAFMLVSIISGVIIHKRIFADFFTFRPGKGQRSWLDGHAVAAVAALPFHLMITATGLVTLMAMLFPWAIGAAYGPTGGSRFFADTFGGFAAPRASGVPGTLADLRPMLATATAAWAGDPPLRLNILNPADRDSTVILSRDAGRRWSADAGGMAFRGTTGEVLAQWEPPGNARAARSVLVGLHIARFADPTLRALFLVSGLIGTAMVGTGLVLWSAARRRNAPHHGHRLVDTLNVATITGLPIAMAAFLAANRALPLHWAARSEHEVTVFFVAWGLALLHAAFRPRRDAWPEQWMLCTLLLVGLVAADLSLGFPLHNDLVAEGDTLLLAIALLTAALGRLNRARLITRL